MVLPFLLTFSSGARRERIFSSTRQDDAIGSPGTSGRRQPDRRRLIQGDEAAGGGRGLEAPLRNATPSVARIMPISYVCCGVAIIGERGIEGAAW